MSSPSVALLRQKFPKAKLSLLTKSHLAGLYEAHRDLDEVIAYEPKGIHRGAGGRLRLARELKAKQFDWAVILPKGFEASLVPWLARIPVRAGWATDRRGFTLTRKRKEEPADFFRHHSDYFAMPLRLLGITDPLPPPYFPLSDASREKGKELLAPLGERVAVFHIGASIAPRRWAPERFAAVAKHLRERGWGIAFIGARNEREQCEAAATRVAGARNLAGETSFSEMAGVIAAAKLFLGNDSGPMHLAGAFGVDTIALFGAGHPGKTLPLANDCKVLPVHAGMACSPCKQRFFKECEPMESGRPACLESIQTDEVMKLAQNLDLLSAATGSM